MEAAEMACQWLSSARVSRIREYLSERAAYLELVLLNFSGSGGMVASDRRALFLAAM
jgi:hypothetical protein